MFVLGIDPGLSRCGYGCVEDSNGVQRAVAAGVITTEVGAPIPERLAVLRREIVSLVAELSPQVVVVERVLFQTNALTAMSVGQASGVALVTAAEAGIEIAEYSSNEVKLAVAGYGSEWRVLFGGSHLELTTAAARIGARVVEERTPSLDEIMVARAGGKG